MSSCAHFFYLFEQNQTEQANLREKCHKRHENMISSDKRKPEYIYIYRKSAAEKENIILLCITLKRVEFFLYGCYSSIAEVYSFICLRFVTCY